MFKSEFLVFKNCPITVFVKQYLKMDPVEVDPPQDVFHVWSKGKDLTVSQRRDVISHLLWELKDKGPTMKFPKGVLTAVALEFCVSHFTMGACRGKFQ